MMAKEMKKNKGVNTENNSNKKRLKVTDRNSLEMFRMFASKNFKHKKEK